MSHYPIDPSIKIGIDPGHTFHAPGHPDITIPTPVYQKWLTLTGPALGTSDASHALGRTIQNALGYPVEVVSQAWVNFEHGCIVITSEHQAFVVYGQIYGAYRRLMDAFERHSPNSFDPGDPISDEEAAPNGGRRSRFQYCDIYYHPVTLAYEVHGAIRNKYNALGGPGSFLGYPKTDELDVPGGKLNQFQEGWICWSDATGACEMHGAILEKWVHLGGFVGFLGYPITGESAALDGGRFNHFQYGSIYWKDRYGAHEVHGAIHEYWRGTGWERGPLGYPISDEMDAPLIHGRLQYFEGGTVSWAPIGGIQVDLNHAVPPSQPPISQPSDARGTFTFRLSGDWNTYITPGMNEVFMAVAPPGTDLARAPHYPMIDNAGRYWEVVVPAGAGGAGAWHFQCHVKGTYGDGSDTGDLWSPVYPYNWVARSPAAYISLSSGGTGDGTWDLNILNG